ncbi:MAG: FG-GAP-like repeat-containing protein [Terriglobales bacterium]|jgi:Big-like domain-containing protein/VCBS repeat protein
MKSIWLVCISTLVLTVIAATSLVAEPVPAVQPAPLHFGPASFIDFSYLSISPDSIATGDLNGDGKIDLVVTEDYGGTVGVLLGNGDGTFQPVVYYSSNGGNLGAWVAIADLNGDGYADVVVLNECDNVNCGDGGIISVFVGNGDGTLQAPVSYGSGGYLGTGIAIADVNGDGHPDLVVSNLCQVVNSNCAQGSVAVLLGNGDGTFQPPRAYASGDSLPSAVAVADLNGDGKLDVVLATAQTVSPYTTAISVLLGNGDGTFQSAVSYGAGGWSPVSIAVADLNGDGQPDVAVASMCFYSDCTPVKTGGVSVLLGNGDGSFQPGVLYKSGGGAYASWVAIGDLNGDGQPDLVVTNMCQSADDYGDCYPTGKASVLPGKGDGTFETPRNFGTVGSETASVAIADVNGDGRPDLVAADECDLSEFCLEGGVAVLLNELSVYPVITLTSSPNPSQVNQTVIFTATITANPAIPNGEIVTFYNGNTSLGTGLTTNGVATLTTSFSAAKAYRIKATYPGDAYHRAASVGVKQVVNQ